MTPASTAAAGMTAAVAARRFGIAAGIGRSERGKFLGQFLRAAMRAFSILPISRTDEDFAVALALCAMEFVNRHERNVAADVSRLKFILERTHVRCHEDFKLAMKSALRHFELCQKK
jgi:hypothetical protein